MRPENRLLKTAVNPVSTGVINSTGEDKRTDVSRDNSIADTGRTDAIKIAESKNAVSWDYEANGADIVLISPQADAGHQTVVLEGDVATDFWIGLDGIESKFESSAWNIETEAEYRKEIDTLIKKFFDLMQPAKGKVSYVVRMKESTSPRYISNVTYDGTTIKKVAFNSDPRKAQGFSRIVGMDVIKQLSTPVFGIPAKLEKFQK
jgi:hypothetical protein